MVEAKKKKDKLKKDEFMCLGQKYKMPVLIPDLANEYYHGKEFKKFIGHSGLVALIESPAHFAAYQSKETGSTPVMEFGSAAHIVMLEDPEGRVRVCELKNRAGILLPKRDAAFYRWKDDVIENEGAEYGILHSEWKKLIAMKDRLFKHGGVKKLLNDGVAEHSGFFLDKMFQDVKGKVRIDYWRTDPKFIIDYKTAKSAKAWDFAKAAYDYGYDIQAAWYVRGMKLITGEDYKFLFIVQEKEPPFAVNCFICSDDFMVLGESRVDKALNTYWRCIENPHLFNTEVWPEDIIELDPPKYALRENAVPVKEEKEVEPEILDIQPLEPPKTVDLKL